MELISKKIRISRLEKTYKQEYMAEELGISQSAYSKIERGETDNSFTTQKDWCYFGIDIIGLN